MTKNREKERHMEHIYFFFVLRERDRASIFTAYQSGYNRFQMELLRTCGRYTLTEIEGLCS